MARKHREHWKLCKTPQQVVDYLLCHGGDPERVRWAGSHVLVKGPAGTVPIQCNHPNEQLQKGILGRLERELVAAGFELVP